MLLLHKYVYIFHITFIQIPGTSLGEHHILVHTYYINHYIKHDAHQYNLQKHIQHRSNTNVKSQSKWRKKIGYFPQS